MKTIIMASSEGRTRKFESCHLGVAGGGSSSLSDEKFIDNRANLKLALNQRGPHMIKTIMIDMKQTASDVL